MWLCVIDVLPYGRRLGATIVLIDTGLEDQRVRLLGRVVVGRVGTGSNEFCLLTGHHPCHPPDEQHAAASDRGAQDGRDRMHAKQRASAHPR